MRTWYVADVADLQWVDLPRQCFHEGCSKHQYWLQGDRTDLFHTLEWWSGKLCQYHNSKLLINSKQRLLKNIVISHDSFKDNPCQTVSKYKGWIDYFLFPKSAGLHFLKTKENLPILVPFSTLFLSWVWHNKCSRCIFFFISHYKYKFHKEGKNSSTKTIGL